MQQGIESIPSPKQQRRPLPSLLSLSLRDIEFVHTIDYKIVKDVLAITAGGKAHLAVALLKEREMIYLYLKLWYNNGSQFTGYLVNLG